MYTSHVNGSCHRLTSLRFCCANKMPTASAAREPDGYRDSSNRLLGIRRSEITES